MFHMIWKPGAASCWEDVRPESQLAKAVASFRSPYGKEQDDPRPWYHFDSTKKPMVVGLPRAKMARSSIKEKVRRHEPTRDDGTTVTHQFVRRFLERFIGKSWAKAYSRLAHRFDSRSRAGYELARVLKYEVVKDLHGRDSGSFYVDETGLLQPMPVQPKTKLGQSGYDDRTLVELSESLEAEKVKGAWYLDTVRTVDPEALLTKWVLSPLTQRHERVTKTRRQWGLMEEKELVGRKQASRKEIAKYGLRTANPAVPTTRRDNDRTKPLRGHGRLQGTLYN